jgi:hypothetical protein
MVDPLVVDEQDRRVVGHDDLWPIGADGPRDLLAQPQRRLHLPIRLVEEVDARHADLGRRSPLLALALHDEGVDVGRRIVAPLVAARDEEVADVGALGDPARHRAGGAELDVVWVGGNDENALRSGQLVVRHRLRPILATQPRLIVRAPSASSRSAIQGWQVK